MYQLKKKIINLNIIYKYIYIYMNLYNLDNLNIFKTMIKGGSYLHELNFYGDMIGGTTDAFGLNEGVGLPGNRLAAMALQGTGSLKDTLMNAPTPVKGLFGLLVLSIIVGVSLLYAGKGVGRARDMSMTEKKEHLISALMAGIFGSIGDVWARCAFYNGALEVDNMNQHPWSYLVVLPMISNLRLLGTYYRHNYYI